MCKNTCKLLHLGDSRSLSPKHMGITKNGTPITTVKSRAVDWSIIQFWDFLAKGHSIKFPFHKPSENVLLTKTGYCSRLYGIQYS